MRSMKAVLPLLLLLGGLLAGCQAFSRKEPSYVYCDVTGCYQCDEHGCVGSDGSGGGIGGGSGGGTGSGSGTGGGGGERQPSCFASADCAAGLECVDASCKASCYTSLDCSACGTGGTACVEGYCG